MMVMMVVYTLLVGVLSIIVNNLIDRGNIKIRNLTTSKIIIIKKVNTDKSNNKIILLPIMHIVNIRLIALLDRICR